MDTPENAPVPPASSSGESSPPPSTDPGVMRRDELSKKILAMTATDNEKTEFGDLLDGTFSNGKLTPNSELSDSGPNQHPQTSETDPELSARKEKYTSDEVIIAFNSQFEVFDSAPEEDLTPQEQADRDLLREIKAKTLDKNRKSITNKFTGGDGTGYSQREHLPVETLLKFAEKRLEDPSLHPETRAAITEQVHVLIRHSKTYADIAGRITPDGLKYSARVIQESERIGADPRLDGVDPEELQTRRRELIIPPKRKEDTIIDPIPVPIDPIPVPIDPIPVPIDPIPVPIDPIEPDPDPIEPPPVQDVVRKFYIVNRTVDIRKRAAELAELAVREEQRRGSGFNPKNWIRKTKMRIGEEYYRQQYMQRAVEAMTTHNNSYLEMDLVKNAAVQADAGRLQEHEAGASKIEQLRAQEAEGLELEGQILREAQGELKSHILEQIIRPAVNGEVQDVAQAQSLLREFVTSHQDDPDIQEVFGRNVTDYGVLADYFATDLLEMAKLVKGDIDANKYALDQLDKYVGVKLAYTDWAAEGRAKFTRVDKIVAGAEKRGIKGRVVNPATIGAVSSIITHGTLKAAGVGGRAASAAVPGAGAITGAFFAAARRSHDLKVDRTAHGVEMAYNSGSPEGLKRREQMEQFAYDTASFDDLVSGGRERSAMGDSRGIDELLTLDLSKSENYEALSRRAAEILIRLDYSAAQSADYITFTGRETVEQNRAHLVKKVVEARQKLRESGLSNDDVVDLENSFREEWSRQLTQNTEQQDRAFRNYRLRSSLASGIYGGATGLVVGLGVREGLNLIGDNLPVGSAMEKVLGGKRPSEMQSFAQNLSRGETVSIGGQEVSLNQSGGLDVRPPGGNPITLDGASISDDGALTLSDSPLPTEFAKTLTDNGFAIDQATSSTTTTLLEPNTQSITERIGTHNIKIPEGTSLVQDATDPEKWDLVLSSDPSRHLIEDITVDANGTVALGQESLGPSLFELTTDPRSVTEVYDRQVPVLGEEGLVAEHGTHIENREWYAHDTPVSEGNELRANNSVFTASNGEKGIVWDMSNMQSAYQSGVSPSPIDVQQVIRDGQAGFAFSFAESQDTPIWVSDLSDGVADGKIVLDPTSTALVDPNNPNSITIGQLSKMTLNQDVLRSLPDGDLASELNGKQNIFTLGSNGKPGFIEAGRLVDDQNGRVLQAFATATGTGEAPAQITISEQVSSTVNDYELTLKAPLTETEDHTIIKITPPLGEDDKPPLVPIPMSPRFPLEQLREKKKKYEEDEKAKEKDDENKKEQPTPLDDQLTPEKPGGIPGDSPNPETPVDWRDEVFETPKDAVWKNSDHDEPVKITGSKEVGGKKYYTIEGSTTGIPSEEVEFSEDVETPLQPEQGTKELTDTFETSSISLAPDEKDDILNHMRMSGGPFNGRSLTPDILRAEHLEPVHMVEVDGKEIYFSNTFSVSGERPAVIAYTKTGDTYTPRTFYRSNSQGVWRYLPAYTRNDSGSIDWYHKGYGEESLTLPASLQEALATIDSSPDRRVKVSDPEFIFAGTASEKRKLTPDMTFVRDTQFDPVKINGTSSPSGQRLDPESVRPTDPLDEPDFEISGAKWSSQTKIYGTVQYETIPSKNGKYTYTFCRSADGKVWIGGIEADVEVGATGLKKKWVTAGDLTTPAYEYSTQAGRYGRVQDRKPGGYVDMYTNYVSRIPMIKEYSLSRGLIKDEEEQTIQEPANAPIPFRPRTARIQGS